MTEEQRVRRALQGVIELREERAEIQKVREETGRVVVRRERRVREETVRVELVSEVLVVTAQEGSPAVQIGTRTLAPGETYEVLLYDERAVPGKETVVAQEVRLFKDTFVREETVPLQLAYEELVVDEHMVDQGRLDPPRS
ncbi:DUF2382 domain-containing protein [Deinococcus multiflagellatus]|uniref:DUF2382 domain-containing protein n=1 Tax=Deinococcus multiflagellatus TaxID=1656887 RepID=A0ABW1ZHJ3_9DEIO|nr:DUF2382 domain-containing protein [Deinococcus multiflagellatus]MBZ9711953.1 YsnF/AvaK domain-containing protein [Deinococcus multiflagellatus]